MKNVEENKGKALGAPVHEPPSITKRRMMNIGCGKSQRPTKSETILPPRRQTTYKQTAEGN